MTELQIDFGDEQRQAVDLRAISVVVTTALLFTVLARIAIHSPVPNAPTGQMLVQYKKCSGTALNIRSG